MQSFYISNIIIYLCFGSMFQSKGKKIKNDLKN